MKTITTVKTAPYIKIRDQVFTEKDLSSNFIVSSSIGEVTVSGLGEEIIEGLYEIILDAISSQDRAISSEDYQNNKKNNSKKLYVFVNGEGLVQFKPTEEKQFTSDSSVQYKGKIKLPKGVRTTGGKKWMDYDYWFEETQIFESRAIEKSKTRIGQVYTV